MPDVTATIWHNPRCSKSREALAILRAEGIEPTIVEYLKHPPSAADLSRIYDRAGMRPSDGLRRAEAGARDLADAEARSILEAMALDPRLIERPLVETEKGAVLARPPERVRDIL